MLANYHTHTRWCNHANGEIEDYIKEAINKGLKELAITEHVCLDLSSPRRLRWDTFGDFNKELDFMKEKYKDQIRIIKGFECEYFPHYMHKYKMLKEKYNYELFVLGQHESIDRDVDFFNTSDRKSIDLYIDQLIEGINTGFFKICAHPDLIFVSFDEDEYILKQIDKVYQACQDNNVVVEINANGYRFNRGYPNFNSLERSKKYNVKYIISSDAHEVEHVADEKVEELKEKVKNMGIEVLDYLGI